MLSQVFNHPPTALGRDALLGQWLALGGAGADDGSEPCSTPPGSPLPSTSLRGRPGQASRPTAVTDPAVAPRGCPTSRRLKKHGWWSPRQVKEELYPESDRPGPIGAWDPETAGQETEAMDPTVVAEDDDQLGCLPRRRTTPRPGNRPLTPPALT